ncbi:discoidin domain-containing protein [Luteolibacter algae]|uniref:Discoidin domain-containing protein n=1 Tax=Luteolibacter algae TaxID=454151 RepID=A0ABW5D7E8_9BACT
MKPHFTDFDDLVWKYLDGEITPEEFDQFQRLLSEHSDLSSRYQLLVEVHNGLDICAKLSPDKLQKPQNLLHFPNGKPILPRLLLISAAVVLVGAIVTFFAARGHTIRVKYVALKQTDFRGSDVKTGDPATNRMMHLMRGAVALEFPSKTTAIIEGPAWYQVQDNHSILLSSGTITVHHQGKPGAFKVITPVGDLTDLGTKFGVTIGNGVTDSMVMTEVYEGEVIFDDKTSTPISIKQGKGFAILGNHKSQRIVDEVNGEDVKVTGTFALTDADRDLKSLHNLALGKPASSSSHYNSIDNGETFGPSALTDNRDGDSGSPWDWSFWLAPNGESGTVTVDLLETHKISRVDLQNTRNRHHADRGLKDFEIQTSVDGVHYTTQVEARLAAIETTESSAYIYERFDFPSVEARYVRIVGKSHYKKEKHRHEGSGGLNEIRIFE